MPLTLEMQRLRAEHTALVTLSQIVLDMTRAPVPPRATKLASARGPLSSRTSGAQPTIGAPVRRAKGRAPGE